MVEANQVGVALCGRVVTFSNQLNFNLHNFWNVKVMCIYEIQLFSIELSWRHWKWTTTKVDKGKPIQAVSQPASPRPSLWIIFAHAHKYTDWTNIFAHLHDCSLWPRRPFQGNEWPQTNLKLKNVENGNIRLRTGTRAGMLKHRKQ